MYVPPSPVEEREPLLNAGNAALNQRDMSPRPPHAPDSTPYQPAPVATPPTMAFPPDPTAYWQASGRPKLLTHLCLGSSILLVVLSFGILALILPLFVGVVGIIISYTLLFGVEMISERIRKATGLCVIGMIVSVVAALQIVFDSLMAGYECETDPANATQSDCIMTFILIVIVFVNLLTQSVLLKMIYSHLRISNAMLNPASSGIIQI
jgi:hypothetical protein